MVERQAITNKSSPTAATSSKQKLPQAGDCRVVRYKRHPTVRACRTTFCERALWQRQMSEIELFNSARSGRVESARCPFHLVSYATAVSSRLIITTTIEKRLKNKSSPMLSFFERGVRPETAVEGNTPALREVVIPVEKDEHGQIIPNAAALPRKQRLQ